MKKVSVLFIVIFGLTNICLYAQVDSFATQKNHLKASPIYIGIGGSYPLGIVVTGGAFSRHGWGGSVNFHWIYGPTKNKPSDYDGGNSLFDDNSDNLDPDFMRAFSPRILKNFVTKSENVLLGIEVGPSFVKTKIAQNFIRNPNPCSIDPFSGIRFCERNYSYERIESKSTGLSLKGKLGVKIPNTLEFEVGVHSNLNSNWSYFGVEILGTLGVFRK
ncbi:MAG: hypothetical protein ACKVU0_08820 [Saprospiraceae bacterium]